MKRARRVGTDSWRLGPWLLGLGLAPFLFGSVNPEHQALLGLIFGIGLLLVAREMGGGFGSPWLRAAAWTFGFLALALPLIPLPISWVEWLSPERARLARDFAVEGRGTDWAPLSISLTSTVRRAWEVALVVLSFTFARFGASRSRIDRPLAATLAWTALLLAATDIWYRVGGSGKLLGVWVDSAGHAAGTFANRNHFANWLIVASLFLLGPIWRAFAIHSHGPEDERISAPRLRGGLIAACAGVAIVVATLTGSRGGLLALIAGSAAWLLLTLRKVRSNQARLGLTVGAVAIVSLSLLGGGLVVQRLATTTSDAGFKRGIWELALSIAARYPLTGVGLGSFERASDHYKTTGGEVTFIHAENEYLQLAAESGIAAAVLGLALLAVTLKRILLGDTARQAPRPELVFSAEAALVAFIAHGLVEFVFQIPATATLGAAMLGYLVGMRDRGRQPIVPAPRLRRVAVNYALGIALVGLSVAQLAAWHKYRRAAKTENITLRIGLIQRSLGLWPWNSDRALALAHAETLRVRTLTAGITPEDAAIGERLAGLLEKDALNWRLRLEIFLMRLAMGEEPSTLVEEGWRIVRINPLQPKLSLLVAQALARAQEPAAVEFLREAARYPKNLPRTLALAWQLEQDTGLLWELAPGTDEGLQQLGDFAAAQGMREMARQAYERLSAGIPVPRRAENHINVGDAHIALRLLAGSSPRERALRARAHRELGNAVEAIREAEALWESGQITHPRFILPAPQASGVAGAEQIFERAAPERDLSELRKAASSNPAAYRLKWMVFQTEKELGRLDEAAQTAVELSLAMTR
ncbi:MAG TPA: O-antigen ligase family protein [Methylomirabilota bacterium]|nr:O-antigen ligase family protein [Methylomirabilota bacterium]